MKSLRIAVIDDEKMLLQVFSSLMRQFGYQADFFSDPLMALQAIFADPQRYQLVIADIKMPGLDGISFIKKSRAVLPKLPIILMTGYSSDDLRQEALDLGNVLYFEKPFPLEATLKEAIPKLVGST